MNGITSINTKDITSENSLDVLRKKLTEATGMAVESVMRMAAIVKRMEELGDDLSGVNLGVLHFIRKIAHGQMLAETLVSFQGESRLLRIGASLAIPDQKRFASDEGFPVYDESGDCRKIKPSEMTQAQLTQVFNRGELRTAAQQIEYLKSNSKKRRRPAPQRIEVNQRKKGIQVGETFITAAELAQYLARLQK